MNYFRLKDKRIKYDNGYYIFEPIKYHKKVTSTTFPGLIGKNKWQSKGVTILERSNLLVKEDIDQYYTLRGNIAERFVMAYLYDLELGYELVTWNAEEVKYDNFKHNQKFGGLIDIAIARPTDKRAVVEVKSKGMDSYKRVMAERGNVEEVLQGKFLSQMANVNKLIMAYVFFPPERESELAHAFGREIVEGIKISDKQITDFIEKHRWSYKVVTIELMEFEVEDLTEEMEHAHKELEQFRETAKIPEKYFRAEDRAYLDELCGRAPEIEPLF